MSLSSPKRKRITAKEAGGILGCSRKTVLNGSAGTHVLTKICNGTRQVRYTHRQPQAGFSLIELLIVVAIIGVIASIAIPNMLASRRAANEAQQLMRTISSCEHAYYFKYGGNATYTDLTTLGARIITANVLSSGDKSGYHFEATPAPNQYWAIAFPNTPSGITQTGTRRFAITEDGVLRGDSDLPSGAPTDHTTVLGIPPLGN
jgi:prepilin-type N-terminal cleavage/methylation domain-containing protein